MFTAHTCCSADQKQQKKKSAHTVLSVGNIHSGHCTDITENQPRVKRNVSTSVLLLGEEEMRYGVSA